MSTDGREDAADPGQAVTATISNGHRQLKWGTITILGGSAVTFAVGTLSDSDFSAIFGLLGMLATLAGMVAWVVGMVLRFKFNRRTNRALPFTPGEKLSLIGASLFLFGVLLVNGEIYGDGINFARLIGIVGAIGAIAGAIWHLLTPRPTKASPAT